MAKTIIHTDRAPAAIGAYSQAVRAGNTIYLSGQIPLVEGGFAEQTRQVFENLKAVIEAAGGSFADVVKLNAYLTDLSNFATFNQIMGEYCHEPFPARAAVQVSALPKGVLVEVEGVVVLNA